MPLDNFFTDGKAHAGSFIMAALAVEPLEWSEYLFDVLLLETNPVILDNNLERLCIGRAKYCNEGLFSFFVELEGISDKVLKDWN